MNSKRSFGCTNGYRLSMQTIIEFIFHGIL